MGNVWARDWAWNEEWDMGWDQSINEPSGRPERAEASPGGIITLTLNRPLFSFSGLGF